MILRIPFLLCLGCLFVVRLLFHLLLQASHARAVRPEDRVLVGQRVKARKVQAVLLDLGIGQQQTWPCPSLPAGKILGINGDVNWMNGDEKYGF